MRATFLQFRNPKEETPAPYFPKKTNCGKNMNKFEDQNESESVGGTFGKNKRFHMGSIYKDVVDRTTKKVGPGTYAEEKVVELLRKKPCMTTIHQPEIGGNEGPYEMQGYTRILQPNYLPKTQKNEFRNIMEEVKGKFGRKINDMLVYRKAFPDKSVHRRKSIDNDTTLTSIDISSKQQKQRRRNLSTFSHATLSPTDAHVNRIRLCYQKALDDREAVYSTRFVSPTAVSPN